jgi:hypothetical protein
MSRVARVGAEVERFLRLDARGGSFPTARATRPASRRVVRVLWGELVTVDAVRLGSNTPPHVLFAGHRLEVVRVDAAAVPAQMVNLKARGDRPDERFI